MRLGHPQVIVRTYQDRTLDRVTTKFKRDAEGLAHDGYSVSRVMSSPADSVLYWWSWPAAKAAMTVTYVRGSQ